MASITKLMTVLVALDRTRPSDVIVVDSDAVGVGGSSVGLRAGERLTARDLVAATMVQSANDAAVALAAHVGNGDPDAFVALMNRRARELGLRSTHFENADGLDATGHDSTAHDLNRLAQVAMREPAIRRLGGDAQRDHRGRPLPAHVERLARQLSRARRGQDGSHLGRRMEPGRGRARARFHDLRHRPRRTEPGRAERRSHGAARMGAHALQARAGDRGRANLRLGRASVRPRSARARGREAGSATSARRACPDGTGCRAHGGRASRPAGAETRRGPRLRPRPPGGELAARRLAVGGTAGNGWQGRVVRTRTLHHLGGLFS